MYIQINLTSLACKIENGLNIFSQYVEIFLCGMKFILSDPFILHKKNKLKILYKKKTKYFSSQKGSNIFTKHDPNIFNLKDSNIFMKHDPNIFQA